MSTGSDSSSDGTSRKPSQLVDFYYRDKNTGLVKGPYVQSQMQEWFEYDKLSKDTEVSVNRGASFRTIRHLINLYGSDYPFCVEDDTVQLPVNNRFYYRKDPKLQWSGPFSDDEVRCFYEKGVFNSYAEISADGHNFVPLGDFVKFNGYRYSDAVQKSDSSSSDKQETSSYNYFYREANGFIKTPFTQKEIQTIYTHNLFDCWQMVEVSVASPTYFRSLVTKIKDNGCRFPFGHDISEIEDNLHCEEFYYIHNGIKGPYVVAQMQRWYERGLISKNTKVSTDKIRFMTLAQLIERNGEGHPFYGEECEVKPQHELDVEDCEEYFFLTDGNFDIEGPFAGKQMQYFYECGRFSDGEYKMATSELGHYKTLKELIELNGSKKPFKGKIENKSQKADNEPVQVYYYRNAKQKEIKGPFVAEQMQKWYEERYFRFTNTRFSRDGKIFNRLRPFVEQNGGTPFIRAKQNLNEQEKRDNTHKGFFFRDGEIRGPFVEAQMRYWYENKVFGDFMEMSIDEGNTFVTLRDLVEINGNLNPFSIDYADSKEEKHGMDLFHLRFIENGECMGPYVEDQLQMWYIRGWFDEHTEVSKNYGEFIKLDCLVCENGNLYPFSNTIMKLAAAIEELPGATESSGEHVTESSSDGEFETSDVVESAQLESSEDNEQTLDDCLENTLSHSKTEAALLHNSFVNLVSEEEHLMEQVSPEATTINGMNIVLVGILFILCEGIYFNVLNINRNSNDTFLAACCLYFDILSSIVYSSLALIVATSFS